MQEKVHSGMAYLFTNKWSGGLNETRHVPDTIGCATQKWKGSPIGREFVQNPAYLCWRNTRRCGDSRVCSGPENTRLSPHLPRQTLILPSTFMSHTRHNSFTPGRSGCHPVSVGFVASRISVLGPPAAYSDPVLPGRRTLLSMTSPGATTALTRTSIRFRRR